MTLTSKCLKTHRPAYVHKVLDGFENGIFDLALLKYLGQEHISTEWQMAVQEQLSGKSLHAYGFGV